MFHFEIIDSFWYCSRTNQRFICRMNFAFEIITKGSRSLLTQLTSPIRKYINTKNILILSKGTFFVSNLLSSGFSQNEIEGSDMFRRHAFYQTLLYVCSFTAVRRKRRLIFLILHNFATFSHRLSKQGKVDDIGFGYWYYWSK